MTDQTIGRPSCRAPFKLDESLIAPLIALTQEAHIRGVIASAVGMYGDLQGIAGSALGEIESLEMPLLEASSTRL